MAMTRKRSFSGSQLTQHISEYAFNQGFESNQEAQIPTAANPVQDPVADPDGDPVGDAVGDPVGVAVGDTAVDPVREPIQDELTQDSSHESLAVTARDVSQGLSAEAMGQPQVNADPANDHDSDPNTAKSPMTSSNSTSSPSTTAAAADAATIDEKEPESQSKIQTGGTQMCESEVTSGRTEPKTAVVECQYEDSYADVLLGNLKIRVKVRRRTPTRGGEGGRPSDYWPRWTVVLKDEVDGSEVTVDSIDISDTVSSGAPKCGTLTRVMDPSRISEDPCQCADCDPVSASAAAAATAAALMGAGGIGAGGIGVGGIPATPGGYVNNFSNLGAGLGQLAGALNLGNLSSLNAYNDVSAFAGSEVGGDGLNMNSGLAGMGAGLGLGMNAGMELGMNLNGPFGSQIMSGMTGMTGLSGMTGMNGVNGMSGLCPGINQFNATGTLTPSNLSSTMANLNNLSGLSSNLKRNDLLAAAGAGGGGGQWSPSEGDMEEDTGSNGAAGMFNSGIMNNGNLSGGMMNDIMNGEMAGLGLGELSPAEFDHYFNNQPSYVDSNAMANWSDPAVRQGDELTRAQVREFTDAERELLKNVAWPEKTKTNGLPTLWCHSCYLKKRLYKIVSPLSPKPSIVYFRHQQCTTSYGRGEGLPQSIVRKYQDYYRKRGTRDPASAALAIANAEEATEEKEV